MQAKKNTIRRFIMARGHRGLVAIILLISFLLLSTACQQGTNNPSGEKPYGESVRVFSGRVSDYNQGEADIIGVVVLGDVVELGVVGTIDSNGRFEVTLLESIPMMSPINEFFNMDDDTNCSVTVSEGVNISPPVVGFNLKRGETYLGGLVEIARPETLGYFMQRDWIYSLQKGDAFVVRFFADADGQVKGSCLYEEGYYADAEETYDLNFKKGWNLVVLEVTEVVERQDSSNPDLPPYSKVSNLMSTRLPPSNATWHFLDNSSPEPSVTAVTVSPSASTIEIGDALILTATVQGENFFDYEDKAVTWSSSDASVAAVTSNGVVTGITEGTASITATSILDNAVSGTATVTVEGEQEKAWGMPSLTGFSSTRIYAEVGVLK